MKVLSYGGWRVVTVGILAGWASIGVAQEQDEETSPPASHPIELKADSCMEEGNWTTQAMRECAAQAHKDWEDEIERLTTTLERVLGSEAREALVAAQEAWQVSRDADYDFIAAYYAELSQAELGSGTLWPLAEQMHRNAVLQDRANQLQRYLDALEELEAPAEPSPELPPE
ncbi:lysozyme inhibitor LprI family protein [Litchfieldella rifensis]|uniref:Lysozyme inhibitor LprI family protein n=1 Tax=Litchfieldella rifensis TaxID=762643 RepID=A0ABV7LVS2_9GAMM